MQNEEIVQLREVKRKLLEKVMELKDKLKDQEDDIHNSLINYNM